MSRPELVADCRALALCVGRGELSISVLELLSLEELVRVRLVLLGEYLDICI